MLYLGLTYSRRRCYIRVTKQNQRTAARTAERQNNMDRPQAGKGHKMKIYKISTNAYDAFVTVDENGKVCRYITESTECYIPDIDINDVEDDSSWKDDCEGMDFNEFLGDAKIINSADF